MTATLTPDKPVADLPVVELTTIDDGWRTVVGVPGSALDTDSDGDPLTLTLRSADEPLAVLVCGSELAWWTVCERLRSTRPAGWELPADVAVTPTADPAFHVVAGPGGRMLVRLTVPPHPVRPSLGDLRAEVLAWARRVGRHG